MGGRGNGRDAFVSSHAASEYGLAGRSRGENA